MSIRYSLLWAPSILEASDMHTKSTIVIGKTVKKLAQLRGGGTALPGLVVEKLDPHFVGKMLSDLPRGVVVISGTNGKTTTTKIVSELLENAGLKVFTNKTGSNFVRGIAAAIVSETDKAGKLPHDIAVLELDEAHAVQFIKNAPVHHALILNVMRDQLDRFGEIDYTASLLEKVVAATSQHVVLNRDDPRISSLASSAQPTAQVVYFGASPSLHHIFVSDDKLHQSDSEQPLPPKNLHHASVELTAFHDNVATFTIAGKSHHVTMQLSGVYNFLNAAGAVAICKIY
jgi:UDP-N-acetylmuramoylalanine-D-glutamate ligase